MTVPTGPANWRWKGTERRILDNTSISETTGCWEWTGRLNKRGYAKARVDGKYRRMHRVAYEHFVGPLIPGMTIDHLCKNKCCVNPKHLEQVTIGENRVRAGLAPPGASHCIKGHEYTEANTYRTPGTNNRACRACQKNNSRRNLARKLAVSEHQIQPIAFRT